MKYESADGGISNGIVLASIGFVLQIRLLPKAHRQRKEIMQGKDEKDESKFYGTRASRSVGRR